jgi:hypothetical protein
MGRGGVKISFFCRAGHYITNRLLKKLLEQILFLQAGEYYHLLYKDFPKGKIRKVMNFLRYYLR